MRQPSNLLKVLSWPEKEISFAIPLLHTGAFCTVMCALGSFNEFQLGDYTQLYFGQFFFSLGGYY